MRKSGVPLLEAVRLASIVDEDVIEAAQDQLPSDGALQLDAVRFGDGAIIDRFIEFLNSELGKALIAIIRQLIGV